MPGKISFKIPFVGKVSKNGKVIVNTTKSAKKAVVVVKPRRAYRSTASLNSRIKKVLNSQLETKYTSDQYSLIVNGDCNPNTQALKIIPAIIQQTSVSSSNVREGDVIEPLRARLKGFLWLDTSTENQLSSKTIYVKMFLMTCKSVKSYNTLPFPTQYPAGLLEDGGADPVTWTSTQQELQAFYPVCKENYTVIQMKTIKLIKNPGAPIGGVTGQPYVSQGADQVPFSFNVPYPSKLKYAQDGDVFPSNYAPILCVVAYSPGQDMNTIDALNKQVRMSYTSDLYYKDA